MRKVWLVILSLMCTASAYAQNVPNLGIQKLTDVGMPDGYRREFGEGRTGPIVKGNKISFAYVGNCAWAQRDQPLDIYAVQVDRSTNKWTKGVIGKTFCSGAHNFTGGHLLQFPDNHPSVTLRGRYIAFFRPHTSVDPEVCTGTTPYCIRYAMSDRPNDVTSWGPVQLVKNPAGATLKQGIPMGMMGGWDANGVHHSVGQGGGTVLYARLRADLRVEGWDIVKGEIASNVNSPGCGVGGDFTNGIFSLVFAPGNCNGAAGPLYYAESRDGGNKWCNAAGTTCWNKENSLLKINTTAPYGNYPSAYLVRGGTYAANVAIGRLSTGVILLDQGAAFNYRPAIWKFANGKWTGYPAVSPVLNGFTAGNLDVIDDNLVIATIVDANTGNNMTEFIIRAGGTQWEAGRRLFNKPSGSTLLTRLTTTTVSEAGVSRIVGTFAVGVGTIQSADSSGRHDAYLIDRPVGCIVKGVDCPAVLGGTVDVPPVTSPAINITSLIMGDTSARVSWEVSSPAGGRVEYGPTLSYGFMTAPELRMLPSHNQNLVGLLPGTQYHYRVLSTNDVGTHYSSDNTFTTTGGSVVVPPPLVPQGFDVISGKCIVPQDGKDGNCTLIIRPTP